MAIHNGTTNRHGRRAAEKKARQKRGKVELVATEIRDGKRWHIYEKTLKSGRRERFRVESILGA